MRNLCLLDSALMLLVKPAAGSITITFDLGAVYTAGGENNVAAGTIGVLVADAAGLGGFARGDDLLGVTLAAGNSFGAGGRIRGLVTATDNLYNLGVSGFSENINISNDLLAGLTFGAADTTTGTSLAFYWFPGITTAGSTITAGQSYGFYREDSLAALAGSGSQMSFNLPQDGSALQLAALTIAADGNLPENTFHANSVVSPAETGFSVQLPEMPLPAAGGTFPVAITSGEAWAASSSLPWAALSSASGTGNAAIQLEVAPNTSLAARGGAIEIGGQSFDISQAGVAQPELVMPDPVPVAVIGSLF
jgi:hypothetical protein